MALLTHLEMFDRAREFGKPAVLLGNGFSRAWNDQRFRYERLFEDAALSERVRAVFDVYTTRDFEAVMRALAQARKVLRGYEGTTDLRAELLRDIRAVRSALIATIREHHPDDPGEISRDQYERCSRFLSRFESIFTTNYDLLLYWVLNWAREHGLLHRFQDGFRQPWGQDELLWKRENAETQNVHFLHGGFHILDTAPYPIKLSWRLRNQSILDQLTEIMNDGKVPLFVSEGTGIQKMRAIVRSPYLSYAYGALQDNEAPLISFGLAFSEADSHIVDAIIQSRAPALFVGVRDSTTAQERGRIRDTCKRMRQRRWGWAQRHARIPKLSTTLYSTTGWRIWN